MEKTAKYLLLSVLIFCISFLLLIFACSFIDVFNISSVQVYGNERHDDSYYYSYLDDYTGKNGFKVLFSSIDSPDSLFMLFALRSRAAETRLLRATPFARGVKVSFLPPDRIRIDIAERKECFRIKFLDRDVYLSGELVVLGENLDAQVPEIKGLDIRTYEAGQALEVDESTRDTILQIYNSSVYMGKSIIDKITSVKLSDTVTLTLSNGIEVLLGKPEDIEYKMKCLNDIYYSYLHEYRNGKLDLSDRDRKVYSPG